MSMAAKYPGVTNRYSVTGAFAGSNGGWPTTANGSLKPKVVSGTKLIAAADCTPGTARISSSSRR
jgi:hypothetical protein